MPNPYVCYSSKFITTSTTTTTYTQQYYSYDTKNSHKQDQCRSTKRRVDELEKVDEHQRFRKKRKRTKQKNSPPVGYPPLFCEVYNPVTLQLVQQTGHQLSSALQNEFEGYIDNVVKGVNQYQVKFSDEERSNIAELKTGFRLGASEGQGGEPVFQEEDQFEPDYLQISDDIKAGGCKQDLVTYIMCPRNSSWQASFFLKNIGCEYSDMGFGVCVPPYASKISPTGGGVVIYRQLAVPENSDCSGWMAGLRRSLEALQRHLLFTKHNNLLDEEATVMVYIVPPDNSPETIMKSMVIGAQLMAPCLSNSHSQNTSTPGFYHTTHPPNSKIILDPSTPQSDPIPSLQKTNRSDLYDNNQSIKRLSSQSPSSAKGKQKGWHESQYVQLQGNTNQDSNVGTSLLDMKQQLFSHKIRIFCVPQQWFCLESPVCHRKVAYESYVQASNVVQADDSQINLFDDIFEDNYNSIALMDQNQLSMQDSNMKTMNMNQLLQSLQQNEIQVLSTCKKLQNEQHQQQYTLQFQSIDKTSQGFKNSNSQVKSSLSNTKQYDKDKKCVNKENTQQELSQQKFVHDHRSKYWQQYSPGYNVLQSDTSQEDSVQENFRQRCTRQYKAIKLDFKVKDLQKQIAAQNLVKSNACQQILVDQQFQIKGLHCCYEFSQNQSCISKIVRAVVVDSSGQQICSGVKYYKGDIEQRRTLQQVLYWVVGFCMQHVKNNSNIHFLSFQKLGYVSNNEQELLENLIKSVVRNLAESSTLRTPLFDSLQYVTLHSIILQRDVVLSRNLKNVHSPKSIYCRNCLNSKSQQIDFIYQISEFKKSQQQHFSVQGFSLTNNFVIKTTDITLFNLVENNLFNRRDRSAAIVIKDAQSPADNFACSSGGDVIEDLQVFQNQDPAKQQPQKLCSKQEVLKQIFQDLIHFVRLTQKEYCGCQFSHVFSCGGRDLCVPINLVVLMQIESLYRQLDLSCVELKRQV